MLLLEVVPNGLEPSCPAGTCRYRSFISSRRGGVGAFRVSALVPSWLWGCRSFVLRYPSERRSQWRASMTKRARASFPCMPSYIRIACKGVKQRYDQPWALVYWTSITHTPSRRHLCRVQTRRIPLRGLGHAHSSVRSRCLPRNRSRRRQSVGTRPRTTDGNCHTRLLHRLPLWVLWSPWASVLMPVWAFYVWESEEP